MTVENSVYAKGEEALVDSCLSAYTLDHYLGKVHTVSKFSYADFLSSVSQ
ncbi:hypothetical protein AsAng_0012610 [Aureispira anguillae]|uniref:Uncharacterized protein n=1 Tax=Aureispira anguillae TaxID=2864201 RepID=A0A915YCH2_9BACT|nr:hypothetical protein AsAng_0012610 [Aureispira anguillae]